LFSRGRERLRQAGFTIRVISVRRRPGRPADQMTIEEQKEVTYTRAILAEPFWKVAISPIATFLSNPFGLLRGRSRAPTMATFAMEQ